MVNILFLSYWGIDDGLTQATVIPHVHILAQHPKTHDITLCTIERLNAAQPKDLSIQKTRHVPLNSKWKRFRILNKAYDFLAFPVIIGRIIKKKQINLIIARGAPAGALIYGLAKKYHIPLVVESFEPHADYMLESGTWQKNGLSYAIEKSYENKIILNAERVITVSQRFQAHLQSKISVKERIALAPCAVNADNFKFNPKKRQETRKRLKLKDKMTGIYVGKFGDLYLQDEAFEIFKSIFQMYKEFQLLVLTPMSEKYISDKFLEFNISLDHLRILEADHATVPDYLSAADFAFAFYKTGASKMGLSPIKTGEYWANGLPIFITTGIGDDSDIISENKIGGIINLQNIDASVSEFLELVNTKTREEWNEEIAPFAKKYRSFETVEKVYDKILSQF